MLNWKTDKVFFIALIIVIPLFIALGLITNWYAAIGVVLLSIGQTALIKNYIKKGKI